jgi:DNA replication protein DnaC
VKTTACFECKSKFNYEPKKMLGREMSAPVTCDDCNKKFKAENAAKTEEAIKRGRETKWLKMCPPLYQDSDLSRLPKLSTEKVLGWKFGPRGLVIYGDTGKGKTRAAFLLCKKLHDKGLAVSAFHGNRFAHDCAKKFGEGNGENWIEGLVCKDVVFFDDLGKFKLTERVEAELFGLIETRVANLKPVIITTNFIGGDLEAKMTADRGEPLVRRLREFCESVAFV